MAIESRLRRLEAALADGGEPNGPRWDVREVLECAATVRAWCRDHGHCDATSALAAGARPPAPEEIMQIILRAEAQRRWGQDYRQHIGQLPIDGNLQ